MNSAIYVGAGLGMNFHPHQQPKSTRLDYFLTPKYIIVGLGTAIALPLLPKIDSAIAIAHLQIRYHTPYPIIVTRKV